MNERELILRAKSGDEKAINELMNTYKTLVKSICRKYFLINLEESDLIQEGMIGLFNAYRSYDVDSHISFSNYASICIKRQIQSAFIKNNRQKNQMLNTYFSINNQGKILLSLKQEENQDEDNGFYLVSNVLSPEESMILKEKFGELAFRIDKELSSFEKQVLKNYLSGLNYIEISTILKKSPKSIDNALSRIKIKLRFLKGDK